MSGVNHKRLKALTGDGRLSKEVKNLMLWKTNKLFSAKEGHIWKQSLLRLYY